MFTVTNKNKLLQITYLARKQIGIPTLNLSICLNSSLICIALTMAMIQTHSTSTVAPSPLAVGMDPTAILRALDNKLSTKLQSIQPEWQSLSLFLLCEPCSQVFL